MGQLQIYIKVSIDTQENQDRPERLGAEICRMVAKVYGVRSAEVTNILEDR